MIIVLKNYFHLVPSKKTFAIELLKVVESKKIMFLYHYGKQFGSGTKSIVLKRDKFKYYMINFNQHQNIYNFFDGGLVDEFIRAVHQNFKAGKHNRTFQGYAEIVYQQRGEIFLENKRASLTNSFESKYFNNFVMSEIRDGITKRIIVNGETGSSWYFKKFSKLTYCSCWICPKTTFKLIF